ncbi:DUF2232 domain-containing protein [Bradyrhizobium sp.]|uniref:DUF2232 domain-containing protein n=1 Tax=Bradyrhizobium sp. TaxID=376 RepID=UPI003C72B761
MIATFAIAIAAGCASALMFASILSGALISLLLLYFAPLPLMVAGLGWGPLAATIGGIAAASALGAIFGLSHGLGFAVTVALPAWWLGHLALLGRPVSAGLSSGNGAAPVAPALEWYPVGRILLWIAGFAILTAIVILLTLGSDAEAITGTLRRGLLRFFGPRDTATGADIERIVDAFVTIAPAAVTITAMLRLTLNLWLAAKITATSGRLHRPWPDLKTTAMPPMTLAALSVALAFCFVGGLSALFAQTVATALMMAYAIVGFAVLHTLTLALRYRAYWLTCAYTIVAVLTWSMLVMVAIGLADAVFGFRQRFLRKRPPPLPAS